MAREGWLRVGSGGKVGGGGGLGYGETDAKMSLSL